MLYVGLKGSDSSKTHKNVVKRNGNLLYTLQVSITFEGAIVLLAYTACFGENKRGPEA